MNAKVVGGAASAALAGTLAGPARPVTVAGAFDGGAYLLLPHNRVLALLTTAAARLPNSVVTATNGWTCREGDRAWVGQHSVRLPGLEVRVVRWWPPRQVRRAPTLDSAKTGLAALVRGLARHGRWPAPPTVRRATAGLARATTAADLRRIRAAAAGLVGLGPGLTPAGDDVLTGLLLGLRALDRASATATDLAQAATAGARAAGERTTALAATLVDHAARGEAADVAAEVVDSMVAGRALDDSLQALLNTGHTSGRDLAEGLLLAWQATLAENWGRS